MLQNWFQILQIYSNLNYKKNNDFLIGKYFSLNEFLVIPYENLILRELKFKIPKEKIIPWRRLDLSIMQ
jgi:hypothetical protein